MTIRLITKIELIVRAVFEHFSKNVFRLGKPLEFCIRRPEVKDTWEVPITNGELKGTHLKGEI